MYFKPFLLTSQPCRAVQVKRCAELAAAALETGHCVVIGLQSTGEANLASARESQSDPDSAMDDFVSAPKMILQVTLGGERDTGQAPAPPSQE